MHLFKIPIQKKITDYKFAAGISYEIFAESKGQNLYFDSYVKECKRRIRNKTCERHTGLPTVKLDAHDFKMIFDTLIENGLFKNKKLETNLHMIWFTRIHYDRIKIQMLE